MHSEFERTPKFASVTASSGPGEAGGGVALAGAGSRSDAATKRYSVKVHWPYLLTEAGFVAYQIAWIALFAATGLVWCALGAAYMTACVLALAFFYGDHVGRVCFVVDRNRLRLLARA